MAHEAVQDGADRIYCSLGHTVFLLVSNASLKHRRPWSYLWYHKHRMILASNSSTLKLAVVDYPISDFHLRCLVEIGIRLPRVRKL